MKLSAQLFKQEMKMNKRIRELAEQAFFDDTTSQPSSKMYIFSELKMQKFAELIVQECATLARNKSEFITQQALSYAEDRDEHISAKATAWQFKVFEQEVKRHFGVEERTNLNT